MAIPVKRPAASIAHGTANNEVPIIVFHIDILKKKILPNFFREIKIFFSTYIVTMLDCVLSSDSSWAL